MCGCAVGMCVAFLREKLSAAWSQVRAVSLKAEHNASAWHSAVSSSLSG